MAKDAADTVEEVVVTPVEVSKTLRVGTTKTMERAHLTKTTIKTTTKTTARQTRTMAVVVVGITVAAVVAVVVVMVISAVEGVVDSVEDRDKADRHKVHPNRSNNSKLLLKRTSDYAMHIKNIFTAIFACDIRSD